MPKTEKERDLIPYKKRTSLFQKGMVFEFDRVWEQDQPKDHIHPLVDPKDRSIFARPPPKPFYKELEEDYDEPLV